MNAAQLLKFVPFYTPAIQEDIFEIDRPALFFRTCAVAAGIFAALVTFEAAAGIAVIYHAFEKVRAKNKILDGAIKEFSGSNAIHPSTEAVQYLAGKVAHVNALIRKKGNLNKLDSKGKSVLDYTTNDDVFKSLVDAGVAVTPEFSMTCINKDTWFKYLLEKNKLNPDDFTPQQQAAFWKSPEVTALLTANNFNINILDENNQTHLSRAVVAGSVCDVARLMRCGADIHVEVDAEGQKATATAFATNPIMEKLLKQENKTPAPELTSISKKYRWIPFLSPALKGKTCEVDHALEMTRIKIVAVAVLIISAFIPFTTPLTLLAPMSLILVAFADMWKTRGTAVLRAIDEYIYSAVPSKKATFFVANNAKAIQVLIDAKADLQKIDEEGKTLVFATKNEKIKKLLNASQTI